MPLPAPRLGLVVQYGFVWAQAVRGSPHRAGKNRPCMIVDLHEIVEKNLARRVLRVTYLPISHTSPRGAERAITLPLRVAEHLGLTPEPSYLYTSYAVEDDWPFDLAPVPGLADRFHYGFVPPRLFKSVAQDFETYLAAHPQMVHTRD